MLGFLMPADVRRNLIDAPMLAVWASCSQRPLRPRLDGDRHSDENSSPEVMSILTSSGVTAERWRRRSWFISNPISAPREGGWMQSSRIHHVGLPVSDRDLSVAWCREALG